MELQLKELTTKQEMLAQYSVMQYLYTNFSLEIQYLPWWYDPKQLQTNCCFEGDVCVGLSSCGLEQNSGLASI
jgi:hypothetical protein